MLFLIFLKIRKKSETSIVTRKNGEMLVKNYRVDRLSLFFGLSAEPCSGGELPAFFSAVSEQAIAEIKGGKKNIDIGTIKYTGLQGACADNDKIGDAAVADQTIEKVADPASGNECQGNRRSGMAVGKPEQINETRNKDYSNTDMQEKETKLTRPSADNA